MNVGCGVGGKCGTCTVNQHSFSIQGKTNIDCRHASVVYGWIICLCMYAQFVSNNNFPRLPTAMATKTSEKSKPRVLPCARGLGKLFKPLLAKEPFQSIDALITIADEKEWSCNVQDVEKHYDWLFVIMTACFWRTPNVHWIATGLLWCAEYLKDGPLLCVPRGCKACDDTMCAVSFFCLMCLPLGLAMVIAHGEGVRSGQNYLGRFGLVQPNCCESYRGP